MRTAAGAGPGSLPEVTVYKSPTCGCCTEWVAHLRRHGFRVKAENVTDLRPIKTRHGVPGELQSCHTALARGYVVEGHVPADLVERLLRERPAVVGARGIAGDGGAGLAGRTLSGAHV